MRKIFKVAAALACCLGGLAGCANQESSQNRPSGWVEIDLPVDGIVRHHPASCSPNGDQINDENYSYLKKDGGIIMTSKSGAKDISFQAWATNGAPHVAINKTPLSAQNGLSILQLVEAALLSCAKARPDSLPAAEVSEYPAFYAWIALPKPKNPSDPINSFAIACPFEGSVTARIRLADTHDEKSYVIAITYQDSDGLFHNYQKTAYGTINHITLNPHTGEVTGPPSKAYMGGTYGFVSADKIGPARMDGEIKLCEQIVANATLLTALVYPLSLPGSETPLTWEARKNSNPSQGVYGDNSYIYMLSGAHGIYALGMGPGNPIPYSGEKLPSRTEALRALSGTELARLRR